MILILFNSNFNRVQQVLCWDKCAFTRGNIHCLCNVGEEFINDLSYCTVIRNYFSYSISVILEEVCTLSVKSGFTVVQNFLLSMTELISKYHGKVFLPDASISHPYFAAI